MEDSCSEIIRASASNIDSSLTESKNEIETFNGQESSSHMDIGENSAGIEGERIHSFCEAGNSSPVENEKRYSARYFIIKSLSHQNIQLSVERGIWATQVMNEPILEEAFHSSDRVILIFSVNMSGFFQGYAQMISSVGWRRHKIWSKSSSGSNPWGRTFKVKWLRLQNLPFERTLHLKNPLNGFKPVKISRDCQELTKDVGEALCGLFVGDEDIKGKVKRNVHLMDGIISKRTCDPPVHVQEDRVLSVPSSHLRWSGETTLHPSLFYQHVARYEEHSRLRDLDRSSSVSFLQNSPSHLESQRISTLRQGNNERSLINGQVDRDLFPQRNRKGLPAKGNVFASLSEEDILNMTYEEYLQAIERRTVPSHLVTAGPSSTAQGSQTQTAQENDPYSRYLSEWYHSREGNGHVWSFN